MSTPGGLRAHIELAGHYARPAVAARIAEFLAAADPAAPAALAAYGGVRWLHGAEDSPAPAFDRRAIMDEGADILRTAADALGTLLLLDLDLAYPADPGAPWRDPERCFALLAPAHRAALAAFERRGIAPLALMTATGFRYLARVRAGGRLHEALAALGRSGWSAGGIGVAEAAHRGAGRLVEHLAHEVVREVRALGSIPVALGDVPPAGADPFVRVDPTAYADRVTDVFLRCPFSSDQTPLLSRAGALVPFVLVLPVGERSPGQLLPLRTDLAAAARYAEEVGAAVPDVPESAALLAEYAHGALGAFQSEMDHAPAAAEWATAPAGVFDAEAAPPCASGILRYPCPRLLQPRDLRTVSLTLWSMGWHPRAIAALVRARYEEPHDWGTHWRRHDPARAAEYFVRFFCASAAQGLDDGAFNCETEGRLASCPPGGCGYDVGLLFRRLRALRAREEAHA